MVTKQVSADDFIDMKTGEKVNALNSFFFTAVDTKKKNIFDVIEEATGSKFVLKPVKTKIMLQCSTHYCRFLTCPNVTKLCVLCLARRVVFWIHRQHATCHNVSTHSLMYQKTFWIPLAGET